MSDKLDAGPYWGNQGIDPGYVRFWIEGSTELATLTASDFRAAMNERDALRAENERLTALVKLQTLRGDTFHEALLKQSAENERLQKIAGQSILEQSELTEMVERLRAALQRIKDESGRVCDEFELCTHVACQSSYHAWSVADAALRGETPESANERALREFARDDCHSV